MPLADTKITYLNRDMQTSLTITVEMEHVRCTESAKFHVHNFGSYKKLFFLSEMGTIWVEKVTGGDKCLFRNNPYIAANESQHAALRHKNCIITYGRFFAYLSQYRREDHGPKCSVWKPWTSGSQLHVSWIIISKETSVWIFNVHYYN